MLAIAAFALLATGAAIPSLEATAVGQVWIGPGETVEREFRVHVAPEFAQTSTGGTVVVGFETASGLEHVAAADAAALDEATIRLIAATDGAGSFPPGHEFPIERCQAGCVVTYRLSITADRVLPASTARYTVRVWLDGGDGDSTSDPTMLRVEIDDPAPDPPLAAWLVIAGILAVVAGVAIGPVLDIRLGSGRRRGPATALVAVLILAIVIPAILRLVTLVGVIQDLDGIRSILSAIAFLVDPWSTALLGILAWGVWRGRGRWADDGGWHLGLATTAAIGLGGLWFVWTTTGAVVMNPFVVGALYVAAGGLAGVVVGQAWRVDPRARHDRAWAAPAVVAHGILIAGFGYLAATALAPSIPSAPPGALILLVPAALLGLAFQRWLRGQRNLALFLDLPIFAIGLLGTFFWFTPAGPVAQGSDGLDEIAIGIAVVAAAIASVTAFHRMPASAGPAVTTHDVPVPAPSTTG